MTKHLPPEIVFLNRKGKFLRRLILEFSDEDLQRLTPSPSPQTIKALLKKVNDPGSSSIRNN